jgi:EmrB/QacA subfamily drug resistance transporter
MLNSSDQHPVNKSLVLGLTIVSSFLNPFMGAAINIALPRISEEFSMNAIQMSWVAMSFLLASAVALVPCGKLADMYGRKKVFMYGNLIVFVSSVFCAISGSGEMLIMFRVVQGIGSAMIFGTTMALVTSVFPKEERGKAIGINVTAVYLGLSVAPVLGGFLTQNFGWRSLFFLVIPIALFGTLATYLFLKAEWLGAKNGNFDYKGSAIYIIAMSAFMFGFSKLPDLHAILLVVAGVIGLIIFVLIELKVNFPVFDIRLFRSNRIFAFSNLAALINYAATFAIGFILSLYLQYVKGMSPREAGTLLITQPLVMALFASVAGKLSDTYNSRLLASLGMAILTAGLLMLTFLTSYTGTIYLIVCMIILGMGFGIFSSPNTNAVMSSVEGKFLGIASATIATMRVTGQMMSLGIATLIIHVFIGESKVSATNLPLFLGSVRAGFIVFTILCCFGVFASLAGGKINLRRTKS